MNGCRKVTLERLLAGLDAGFVYGGNAQELVLSCNGHEIATVSGTPMKPVLCKNTDGEWGVYIPPGSLKRLAATPHKVVFYTDNTQSPYFSQQPFAITSSETPSFRGDPGSDPFVAVQDQIEQLQGEDAEGELFMAWMPESKDSLILKGDF